MNIYLLQQDVACGYDTYDSCVVVADNEIEAAKINPGGKNGWSDSWQCYPRWARSPDQMNYN